MPRFVSEGAACIGPYSPAAVAGGLIFPSGQLGLRDGRPGAGVAEQAEFAFQNLRRVLECAGGSLRSVVKCDVILANLCDLEAVDALYVGYFESRRPARSVYQAALPPGLLVELVAVALVE